jgi:hypothetical protein
MGDADILKMATGILVTKCSEPALQGPWVRPSEAPRYTLDEVRAAVLAEREACAQLAHDRFAVVTAAAIRAREPWAPQGEPSR